MKHLKSLGLAVLLLSLTSCSAVQQSVSRTKDTLDEIGMAPVFQRAEPVEEQLITRGMCPEIVVVGELAHYFEFDKPDSTRPENVVSRARLSKLETTCSYGPKSVTVDMKLAFEGVMGSAGRAKLADRPSFSYPYFIAIRSPGGVILAKQVFAVSMDFPPGQDTSVHYEQFRQIIPIASQEIGSRHKIMVGFQLSKEQLEFNRDLLDTPDMQAEMLAQPKTTPINLYPLDPPNYSTSIQPVPLAPPGPVKGQPVKK